MPRASQHTHATDAQAEAQPSCVSLRAGSPAKNPIPAAMCKLLLEVHPRMARVLGYPQQEGEGEEVSQVV